MKELVEPNTKKQECPALSDWFEDKAKELGIKTAEKLRSVLRVRPSFRRYNDPDRHLPGTEFLYDGKRYVMQGQITNGTYFRAVGQGNTNFPTRKCKILGSAGLVYVK